jgi:hypothetical protein
LLLVGSGFDADSAADYSFSNVNPEEFNASYYAGFQKANPSHYEHVQVFS